jgi:2-dehydro-3-deoxygalactonokinase
MSEAALIGIDWGTSNRRAWLFDGRGGVIAARRDDNGISRDDAPGFAEGLDLLVKDWPPLPTLMAGMIGSRNGWMEAPYVQCPAGLAEIAARLVPVGDRADLVIVPGLSLATGQGDVMRGEETQIIGLAGRGGPSLAVLPGTHSKWVRIGDDRIDSFRTFPTGELFAAILDHTVVGVLAEGREVTVEGFDRGLARAGKHNLLLANLFAARADILLGLSSPRDCTGYLSGLLIGAEVREGLTLFGAQERLVVVGSDRLVRWYARALERSGARVDRIGDDAAAAGLWRIATAAGLVA